MTDEKKTSARLNWRYGAKKRIYSSPALGDDGTVYVGSGDANLYSLETESSGPADSPWPMFGRDRKRGSNSAREAG